MPDGNSLCAVVHLAAFYVSSSNGKSRCFSGFLAHGATREILVLWPGRPEIKPVPPGLSQPPNHQGSPHSASKIRIILALMGCGFQSWRFRQKRWPLIRLYHGSFLEKAVAAHSSTLAWKIPWTEEPGRLQSMGSLRVRHDWGTSLSLFTFMHWRRKWQPTPLFLPGESQGQGSLVGCRLWGRTESDTTEVT